MKKRKIVGLFFLVIGAAQFIGIFESFYFNEQMSRLAMWLRMAVLGFAFLYAGIQMLRGICYGCLKKLD